jgi:hypothetical protein
MPTTLIEAMAAVIESQRVSDAAAPPLKSWPGMQRQMGWRRMRLLSMR